MHALSLGTWWIHIATLFEWIVAIILIFKLGEISPSSGLTWLAIAMLPNLASAMAAITWHLFDNSPSLQGLVVLQAGLTMVGNCCLALAAWKLVNLQGSES